MRVITATNRRLEDEIKADRFREDLYYRLSVFPIHIPPLRERREDIPVLARHLVHRLSAQLRKSVGEPTPEALEQLVRHPFPGNVRELANELERAILLADPGAPITEDLLSEQVQGSAAAGAPPGVLQARTNDFERQQIVAALERAGGVKTKVADELGLSYRGLMKKLRRLGTLVRSRRPPRRWCCRRSHAPSPAQCGTTPGARCRAPRRARTRRRGPRSSRWGGHTVAQREQRGGRLQHAGGGQRMAQHTLDGRDHRAAPEPPRRARAARASRRDRSSALPARAR